MFNGFDPSAEFEKFHKQTGDVGIDGLPRAEGKTHGTINSDLGLPDDKPTQALWEFFDGVLKRK